MPIDVYISDEVNLAEVECNILLHKLIYSHPYLNDSETLLQKEAMENKSSKPLHQCYNISGFPSNQQKRVSERTLVKVRGQGHSARSKSTGLLQV